MFFYLLGVILVVFWEVVGSSLEHHWEMFQCFCCQHLFQVVGDTKPMQTTFLNTFENNTICINHVSLKESCRISEANWPLEGNWALYRKIPMENPIQKSGS